MNRFEEVERKRIDSLKVEFRQFVDQHTGARHIHLASDDTNNAFMVAFPTRPHDSSGVAHILEHTTLCGSRSYPVRDPFFMMLRRSLNTFMNAFTSSDCTAYPFATQNRKDFDNLLKVYLDSVFFPILDPLDFAQEGWRLDFSEDGEQLVYKGVVYNEMKGAMSSPVAQLWQHLSASLFPDTIYAHNSGGDPLAITDLGYEELKAFHQRHYHPSHAMFMTYGSFAVEEHQGLISERVLENFTRAEPHAALGTQPVFGQPVILREPYEIDDEDTIRRKTHALWGWTLGATACPQDYLEAQFLSALLLDNSASPLRFLLETTEFADAPSELCGIDDSAQQLVFAAGVEGCDEENVDVLEQQVLAVLERMVEVGVEDNVAEGVIDSIEMQQRDVGGDSYPYGLQLMGRILPAFVYGAEPENLLSLDKELDRLRESVKDESFVSSLVRRRLLENPHRTRVVMWPDRDKAARDLEFEQKKLGNLASKLSTSAKLELKDRVKALEARQMRVEDVNVLPKVTLADVPLEIEKLDGETSQISNTELNLYDRPTNGLFYANLIFDISALSRHELEMLPFFTEFLLELGSGEESFASVQQRRAQIGIFSAYSSARNDVSDIDQLSGRLVLTSKSLARKSTDAVSELAAVLANFRLDETSRLKDLITQERADAEASVVDRGHLIAMLGAATSLTPSATLDDYWQGPQSILHTQALEREIENGRDLNPLTRTFASIRDKLLAQQCRVLFVGETKVLNEVSKAARDLSFNQPDIAPRNEPSLLGELPVAAPSRAWLTASQINFCARAHRAVSPGDDAVAALLVLSKYLQDGFLHPAIREAGGAYGSGAQYDAESSTFRFFSYRDPRLVDTFNDFSRSIDWLAENNDSERLEESILGVIRQLDKPKTPAGAAFSAFYDEMDGVGYDFRKRLREKVLATSYVEVLRAAERFLGTAPSLSVVSDRAKRAEIEQLGLQTEKLA